MSKHLPRYHRTSVTTLGLRVKPSVPSSSAPSSSYASIVRKVEGETTPPSLVVKDMKGEGRGEMKGEVKVETKRVEVRQSSVPTVTRPGTAIASNPYSTGSGTSHVSTSPDTASRPRFPGCFPILIWLDLEMSGRNHDVFEPLEIAFELSDTDLVDIPNSEFVEAIHTTLIPPDPANPAAMELVAWNMHQASGLLERVRKSTKDIRQVEMEAVNVLERVRKEYATRTGTTWNHEFVIAGSSPHFDYAFLRRHLPAFFSYLKHQVFDVTTIMMMSKWGWLPGFRMPRKTDAGSSTGSHTAKIDVKDSRRVGQTIKFYFQNLVMSPADYRALTYSQPQPPTNDYIYQHHQPQSYYNGAYGQHTSASSSSTSSHSPSYGTYF